MGKPKSPEHRAKIAAANKGHKFTDEHRAKLREAWKTRLPSPAFLAAAKVAAQNREWTVESRRKMSASKSRPLSERFWSKVDIRGIDECWPWLGYKMKKGFQYGVVGTGSRLTNSKRTELAHRVAYELANGPLDGLNVLHRCDNPPCCNPAHLFKGTQLDNMRDCQRKGRIGRFGRKSKPPAP